METIMWGIIAALVAVEALEVGLKTLSKAAMTKVGMSDFVFVVYSNALAFLFTLPLSFIFRSCGNRPHPRLTICIIFRIFVLGIVSTSAQIFTYFGIGFSSPTLATAMNNLIPSFTFVLAIITRMEKLDIKVRSTQAKSIGTVVSITGAFVMTLYEGPPILLFSSSLHSNWIIGGILLVTASFLLSLLFIAQTWIIKDYPSGLRMTVILCFFVTILAGIVALIAERNPLAWELNLDMELLTIVYSGILVVGVRTVVHAWALDKKGPVFVSMFKPLEVVIAVVLGISFLGNTLHIGSVIGAAIIAIGFYSVMWGKAKEEKIATSVENGGISTFDSSSDNVPLLQNRSLDI